MSTTLVHVILSGIVSLIPLQNGSFLIRLQDARTEHGHFPTLLLEGRNVVRAPAPDMQSSPRHPLYQAWLLGDGELTVAGAPGPPLEVSALTDVLRIADACPSENCGIAEASFPKGVQISVHGGLLATTGIEPYLWHFTTEDSGKARRIAEEVCWTFEIPGSVLALSVPSPQGGKKTFRIRAQPGEDIEIRLQNAELIDTFPQSDSGTPDLDTHVNMYFELSKYPPQAPVYLEPVAVPVPPTHPSHRLAGRQILRSLSQSPRELKLSSGVTASGKTIRENCPPSLWDGIVEADSNAP